jgi:hypothetical protein
MEDSDFREAGRPLPPAWSEPAATPDVRRANDPSTAYQCGLVSLLCGCAMGLGSVLALILNMLILQHGPRGLNVGLSFAAGLIGVIIGSVGGIASLIFGISGWIRARPERASPAMPMAGVGASAVSLVLWIIAATALLMALGGMLR